MKVILLTVLFCLFHACVGFFAGPVVPPVAPVVPPVAPIVPPLLPPILPPILPPALLLARPLLARRIMLSSLLLGKREVLSSSDEIVESSVCEYTIESSILNCRGLNQTLQCEVVERFEGLPIFDSNLTDMFLVRKNESDSAILKIVGEDGDFTFSSPETHDQITLSIYNSENVNLPGLRVIEQECWNQVEKMYEESSIVTVNINV